MKPDKAAKLSKGISGIAGEYFVAAELSRRGFMASITLRNNDSIDIHASKDQGNKLIAIQVKTNQFGHRSWPIGEKCELLHSQNLFYIFVALKELDKRPEYFIVPSLILAPRIKKEHADWLATPGRKGQARKDSNIREFTDKQGEYLEAWHLLD